MKSGVVNIRGKEYQTVPLRVKQYREGHPIDDGWAIRTSVVHRDADEVVMRAEIVDPTGRVVGVGHAEERRSSSSINKTSALENCETSAIGRALAAAGYAGDESMASAEEVAQAIAQQEARPKPDTAKQWAALLEALGGEGGPLHGVPDLRNRVSQFAGDLDADVGAWLDKPGAVAARLGTVKGQTAWVDWYAQAYPEECAEWRKEHQQAAK